MDFLFSEKHNSFAITNFFRFWHFRKKVSWFQLFVDIFQKDFFAQNNLAIFCKFLILWPKWAVYLKFFLSKCANFHYINLGWIGYICISKKQLITGKHYKIFKKMLFSTGQIFFFKNVNKQLKSADFFSKMWKIGKFCYLQMNWSFLKIRNPLCK